MWRPRPGDPRCEVLMPCCSPCPGSCYIIRTASWSRKAKSTCCAPTWPRLATAERLGAWGGKATGAGGGGCVAILTPPERRREVLHALAEAGGEILDAVPRGEPLRLEVEEG